ncbi:hypothetical protein M422DRAFT_55448 [Sphaerobolus stellatus SS14]|uniref:Uncharacterized protein n=1 Tax=Sphaerobolus stellatus (strain SS14) TaxID=990650 RepID=A0A0C9UM90_SPHS4|nr:hypothetical protein M422DRAFT_55448 [Sphaerobolus stellatus SS14]
MRTFKSLSTKSVLLLFLFPLRWLSQVCDNVLDYDIGSYYRCRVYSTMGGSRIDDDDERKIRRRESKQCSYHNHKDKCKAKRLHQKGKAIGGVAMKRGYDGDLAEEAEILDHLQETSPLIEQESLPSCDMRPVLPLTTSSLPPSSPPPISSPTSHSPPRKLLSMATQHYFSLPYATSPISNALDLIGTSRASPSVEDVIFSDQEYTPSGTDSESDSLSDASDCSCPSELVSPFWSEYEMAVDRWWELTDGISYNNFLAGSQDFILEASTGPISALPDLLEPRSGRVHLAERLLHQGRLLAYTAIECEAADAMACTINFFQMTYTILYVYYKQVKLLKEIISSGIYGPWEASYIAWWETAVLPLVVEEEGTEE